MRCHSEALISGPQGPHESNAIGTCSSTRFMFRNAVPRFLEWEAARRHRCSLPIVVQVSSGTCARGWRPGTRSRALPRRAGRWTPAASCQIASWMRCCRVTAPPQPEERFLQAEEKTERTLYAAMVPEV